MELIIPRISTGRKKYINVFKRHREEMKQGGGEKKRGEGGRKGRMDGHRWT